MLLFQGGLQTLQAWLPLGPERLPGGGEALEETLKWIFSGEGL